MTISYDDSLFRAQFPAFKDNVLYAPSLTGMFWGVATDFISAEDSPCFSLSGDSRVFAINCMTAHLLTINQSAASGANKGKAAGKTQAFIASSTVDKVSIQRLAPPAKDMWTWWLSSTPYGQQLAALLEVKGVGGFSVGGLPESSAFRRVGGVYL